MTVPTADRIGNLLGRPVERPVHWMVMLPPSERVLAPFLRQRAKILRLVSTISEIAEREDGSMSVVMLC